MSNPKDGKGFHLDFSKIPLPVIILAYICYFPAGVILTVLRIFGPSAQDEKQGNAKKQIEELLEKKEAPDKKSENAQKRKTTRKPKKSAAAGILYTLAVLFVFCGVIQTLNDAKTAENMLDFLRNILLNDSIIFYLMGIASCIAGYVCKGKTERQNVLRSIIGNRDSIHLNKLSSISGASVKKIRKDLQSMIDKGEFGEEAYIDMEKNVFMRTPGVEPDLDPNGPSAKFSAENEEETPRSAGNTSDNFRSIILEIRRLNDDIKDFAVSERIYRIEEHTQNIFDYVTEHPEAMPQIRTFLNYYLPTTLKLLESYRRIEQVGVAGENMKKSKENIESILDMLVKGYEQQVDQLFRHESIDISTEISVLETMMKQDGLGGQADFDFGSAAAQSMPEDK